MMTSNSLIAQIIHVNKLARVLGCPAAAHRTLCLSQACAMAQSSQALEQRMEKLELQMSDWHAVIRVRVQGTKALQIRAGDPELWRLNLT